MLRRVSVVVLGCVVLVALAAACKSSDGKSDSSGQEGPVSSFSEACQKTGERQFSDAPSQIIDTGKTYVATISTAKGQLVVELNSDVVVTTNNFVFLACKGFYDGLMFHRVEPGFVIQGGDPQGTGMGGPGYAIPGEFEGAKFERGVIGMARSSDPDSAGSQFYIVTGPASHLDGKYAAFGRITSGIEVADQIQVGDAINSVTIEER